MITTQEIDKILAERLRESGTRIDGIQLIVFAEKAKSAASEEEQKSALQNLQQYETNDDPFE